MEDTYGTAGSGVRVFKRVVAWMALAALMAVGFVIWSGFRVSLQNVASSIPSGTSAVATPSADANATSVVTSTVAVTRVDGVQLRFSGNPGAQVLRTVKKGTTLQVLSRTSTWLRVKDPSGHIGWIENSTTTVEIRKK